METYLVLFFSSCLCLFLSALINFIYRVWWTPIRIQNIIRSQGIKGPSYNFLHGNTKQIIHLRKESMGLPMDLSHHIFPRVLPHIYTWVKLYGMNFLFWFGLQPQLVVTEPELIKEIFNNKHGAYSKPQLQENLKKLIGDGLVTTRGEKWVKLRKLANHAFHAESLKVMIPTMVATVEAMLERWRSRGSDEVEVFQEFKILTSEVISRTAFGSSYLEGQSIFEMLMKITLIISRNYYKIKIPGIGKFVKTHDDIEMDKLVQGMRDTIKKIIKKREDKAVGGEVDDFGSDYLGLLIKASHETDISKRIYVDDMIDECKTFYIGGHDTTTSSLTWTVLLLAVHPDWQEKARKEVLELFGQENPNPDGISRLKTMSMIINESLRLYTPVVSITRNAEKEVKLGKFTIPAKTDLHISTLALHHSPQIWGKDAHLFKPERFAEGVAKATNNNTSAFVPFGLGPRTCVGSSFANTETKIALSMILQRYKFIISPNYVHSPVPLLTVCPKNGVQIILQAL